MDRIQEESGEKKVAKDEEKKMNNMEVENATTSLAVTTTTAVNKVNKNTNAKNNKKIKKLKEGKDKKNSFAINDHRGQFKRTLTVLRDKLTDRRNEIEQHVISVQNSCESEHANDICVANQMGIIREKSEETRERPPHILLTASPSVIKKKTAFSRRVKKKESFQKFSSIVPRRKSIRELQDQVEGLQELLSQLTLQDVTLKDRVFQLAKNNTKLKQLKMFVATRTNSDLSENDDDDDENEDDDANNTHLNENQVKIPTNGNANVAAPPTINGDRPRYESEMSTASSNASRVELANNPTMSNQIKNVFKKQRKRARKHKTKKLHTELSEMEALTKYINKIIGEFLDNKEQLAQYEFKGGIDELESYAQRLVQGGFGRIVEDEIRINRKNNRQSFITMSTDRDGPERDGMILLPVARRYAFEGDIVRAFVLNASAVTAVSSGLQPDDKKKIIENSNTDETLDEDDAFNTNDDDVDTPDSDPLMLITENSPKAFVISIVKQTELRQVIGIISFSTTVVLNDDLMYYKLKPYDMRVPMMYIPEEQCKSHITDENKIDICGFLYLAQVRVTDLNGHCIGELVQPVGKVGNLEAEMKAIMLHNGLQNILPYEEKFNELFAKPDPPITEKDLINREDLRSKCIFTIDPLTARDLDDAMSVECIGENEFEVGVHISDVTFYLEENSELDNIVKDRATSIYLVNEVIHMLPKPLCFKCSLLPGEDKFTFSVFWRLNSTGDILGKPRFTRSIINSCTQLAYQHAQKIIDNPTEKFTIDDFPIIVNNFTPADIAKRIIIMHNIAQNLRQKRYKSGALTINNPKLRFVVDPISGEPINYEIEDRQEANFLIEEFMLLANQSVARFIYDNFPDISILRNHAPPLSKSMKAVREKLNKMGYEFEYNNSQAVYTSMQRICGLSDDPQAMDVFLSALLTKPMARAKYFCSEGKTDESDLWHYALSIPIYTHFTSPIRRYPDILVHRLLSAALNYTKPPQRTTDELHQLAKVCNDQKYNAKNAGDESINLFFKRYIKSKKYIVLRAVVIEVFQHLMNVITIETGHALSIHYKVQRLVVDASNAPSSVLIEDFYSDAKPLKVQTFSIIDIKVSVCENKICGYLFTADGKRSDTNNRDNGPSTSNNINGPQKKQKSSLPPVINGYKSKDNKDSKLNKNRTYAIRKK